MKVCLCEFLFCFDKILDVFLIFSSLSRKERRPWCPALGADCPARVTDISEQRPGECTPTCGQVHGCRGGGGGPWTRLNGLDFDVRLYLSRGGDIQHTCG